MDQGMLHRIRGTGDESSRDVAYPCFSITANERLSDGRSQMHQSPIRIPALYRPEESVDVAVVDGLISGNMKQL